MDKGIRGKLNSTLRQNIGAIAGALASLLAFTILHWRGIAIPSDGWAYWQGAVSLFEGHGYRYFSGTPITAWPPLYSIYLAFWTALLGPTGFSLVVANGVLIVVQGFLWSYVILRVIYADEPKVPSRVGVVTGVYLGLFVTLHQQQALASNLQYVILPLFLLEIWRLCKSDCFQSESQIPVIICATALVLSHNASFAFLFAGVFLVITRTRRYITNAIESLPIWVIPVALWIAIRMYLGQTGSHAVGVGEGRYGPKTYFVQLTSGIGSLIFPHHMNANYAGTTIVGLSLVYGYRTIDQTLPTFTLLVVVGMYCLFNSVYIRNPISSPRFIMLAPIVAIPICIAALSSINVRVSICAAVVLSLPVGYWVASWSNYYIGVDRSGLLDRKYGLHEVRVSPDYPEGPPRTTDEGILLSPKQWEEPKAQGTSVFP